MSVAAGTGVDFVASDQIGAAARQAGLDADTSEAIVDDYEQAQLVALKAGLLAAALLALLSLAFTAELPHDVPSRSHSPSPDDRTADDAAER